MSLKRRVEIPYWMSSPDFLQLVQTLTPIVGAAVALLWFFFKIRTEYKEKIVRVDYIKSLPQYKKMEKKGYKMRYVGDNNCQLCLRSGHKNVVERDIIGRPYILRGIENDGQYMYYKP